VCPVAGAQSSARIKVAAAANLRYAMEELARLFQKEFGVSVGLSIGASGSLLQQVRSGAPFELYMAADEHFVLELARLGLGANGPADHGVVHSLGSLALCWNSRTSGPSASTAWRDYIAAAPKLAIANPEHAPYGRAALQWLERVQLVANLKGRLVLGDSAAQALQFVSAGAAPCGLLPSSLAQSAAAQPHLKHIRLLDLPGNPWSPQLRQRMLLLRGASANAKKFYDWLQQGVARATLQRHGFELP
jgi:molybdate transport system substrate-binding protein